MLDEEDKGNKKRKGKHPHNELTPAKVRNLSEAGFYADGNGLYLKVDKSGAKRWIQRLLINRKRTDLGLGSVALVPLKEAREKALDNRRTVANGGDPLAERRRISSVPTFKEAAYIVYKMHLPTWSNPKHGKQWIRTLEKYAFPFIGAKKVNVINSADILAVLSPVWTEKHETANRIRQRIGAVIKWSMAQGWRTDNPADTIGQALPKPNKAQKHHKSLPYDQVAKAIQTIYGTGASDSLKLSFEFLVLTASRLSEVRNARWCEVEGNTWVVPVERMMKSKKIHRVPLPDRCMEILREAKSLACQSEYIFPTGGSKPYSDAALSKLLKENKIGAVPHGFRSSFRVWASEQTGVPHQVCEFALAHVIGNKAEAAYQRSDLFEKRRTLMALWANYLDSAHQGAEIVPIGKGSKAV